MGKGNDGGYTHRLVKVKFNGCWEEFLCMETGLAFPAASYAWEELDFSLNLWNCPGYSAHKAQAPLPSLPLSVIWNAYIKLKLLAHLIEILDQKKKAQYYFKQNQIS